MYSTNFINSSIGNFFVNANCIIRCEAHSNYTKLFFTDKKPLVLAKTLSACAAALSNSNFIRIHHSHLINKNYIQSVEADGNLYLKDGTVCKISRRKKRIALQIIRTNSKNITE